MNTIKTITTVDGMNAVDFSISDGNYYWFRNLGDTTVYVSGNENITAGADGVAELTSGGSVCLEGIGGKVYILGAGKVEIHKSGNKHCPFKVAPEIGGGKEVSGESSYTLTNAVDYPLMGLNLYGKSVQDGVPTPENPVDIVSVGDSGSVAVQSCGKNLLNLNKCNWTNVTINGVSFVRNNNGEIIVNGTATATASRVLGNYDWQGKIPAGKYYISGCPKTGVGGGTCRLQFTYDTPSSGKTQIWQSNAMESVLTVPNDYTYWGYTIVISEGFTANNLVFKPMLCTVDSEKTFEPYHGATANITSAMPLCGIPVESGGNYTDSNGQQWVCDTLEYNADGTGKITKRTAKIDSYNSETITTPYISTMGGLTTGATIIYQIAEPQEIELTAAEMSALMSLQTFNGVTNIFNDGGADMDVYYCSNKTLSEYVMPITMGLQKQIDELRAAVLSLGGNV